MFFTCIRESSNTITLENALPVVVTGHVKYTIHCVITQQKTHRAKWVFCIYQPINEGNTSALLYVTAY